MNCSNCNAEIEAQVRFCPDCGTPNSPEDSLGVVAPEGKRKSKALFSMVFGVVLLGALGAGAYLFFQQQAQQAQAELEANAEVEYNARAYIVDNYFKLVVTSCEVLNSDGSDGIDFDELYLSIDAEGDEDRTGANYEDIACLLYGSEIPDGVISRIDATTSLQGVLEDSWIVRNGLAEIEASWSYHPSSGLNMSMKIVSDYQEPFDFAKHYEWVKESLEE